MQRHSEINANDILAFPILHNFGVHVKDMLVTCCNPPMAKLNTCGEDRKRFKSPQSSIKQDNLNMTLEACMYPM